jgi:hypothetical protein
MNSLFTVLLAVLYILVIAGVVVFALVLFNRFVNAHQRCAAALEVIAQKLPNAYSEPDQR